MLPTLVVFGFGISLYATFYSIGIVGGGFFCCLAARRMGYGAKNMLLFYSWAVVGFVLCSKLMYAFFASPGTFWQSFLQLSSLLALFQGGNRLFGGLAGAIAFGFVCCRFYRLPFLRLADIASAAIALILACARLGCFFAGCCYGITYSGPFHVIFHNSSFAPNGVLLFPVQPAEALFEFLLFWLLLWFLRRQKAPGLVVAVHMACYGTFRFVLEFARADAPGGQWWGIKTAQWLCILLGLCGALLALWLYKGKPIPK